jgi:hypothetical protein
MNNGINSFREKHTKYRTYINTNKNNVITTLDTKHNEKITEFSNQNNLLTKKKKIYKKMLKELNDNNNNDIQNNINKLKLEIDELENNINKELDYYDDTIDILLDYYSDNKKMQETNIIDIADIFKKKDIIINGADKSKLYDKYMKKVYNVNTRKTKQQFTPKICNKCKVEKTIHANEGYIICMSCGDSEPILIESDKVNYKDNNTELKACAYKRINHLSEILNQFQAKESTEINEEIYDRIKNELNIQRIYDYNTLEHKCIKKILKKLKLNKYYEHTHHIINVLNGIPPPTITREQEENIKKIFKDIQKPFTIYRPKKRKNFLNYNYIIHKICELLEYDNFLPHFPLLKSRINLEEQDIVWEKICKYKNYEFIPSI